MDLFISCGARMLEDRLKISSNLCYEHRDMIRRTIMKPGSKINVSHGFELSEPLAAMFLVEEDQEALSAIQFMLADALFTGGRDLVPTNPLFWAARTLQNRRKEIATYQTQEQWRKATAWLLAALRATVVD